MKDILSEQFIVVNEKDEIIGYKSRYECHHNPSLIHRAVEVILRTKEGKVIMQKRNMQKDLYPGYFCVTASGHVNKDETYESAAQRELSEEMGIKGVLLQKRKTFITREIAETEMITLFTGEYNGEIKFASDEVELSLIHI